MEIKKYTELYRDLVIERRRHIHENPELSNQEVETVKYIISELKKDGMDPIEIKDGGVITYIRGPKPGKTILLRADCDALPIDEPEFNLKRKRTCRSKNPGVMHACGHDTHTATLLTAAKILNEQKEELEGTVLVCFERGEEGGGNIRQILQYFEDNKIHYDAAFGLHADPTIPAGKFFILDGESHATGVPINVKIHGRGGHGSRPDLANNPIECMVAILNSVYNIRMKYLSPFENVTVSPCMVKAGTKGNVIPDDAEIQGSARCYSREVAAKFYAALKQICTSCAEMYGCTVEVAEPYKGGYPVINNIPLAQLGRDAIRKHMGEDVIVPGTPTMGSESYALYGLYAPAIIGRMGTVNEEKGTGANLHNQFFDIDEENALPVGVGAYVSVAYEYLRQKPEIEFTPKVSSVAEIYK